MDIEIIKKEYKEYLDKRGDLNPSTIQTSLTSAFYLLRVGEEELFWNLVNAPSMPHDARKKILDVLIKNNTTNPEKNVSGYFHHLKLFRSFCLISNSVTKEEDYIKFKKLLEWFVNQLKINNGVIQGDVHSGQGYKGHKIKNYYSQWSQFEDFSLDCSIQAGPYADKQSNYIHYTSSYVNLCPVFNKENEKSDVVALRIVIKENNVVKYTGLEKTIEELGLFDGAEPSANLIELFEEYKKEINSYKDQKNEDNQNDINGEKSMTDVSLNTILYGPPGTGKTYNTVRYAVAIIENKKLTEIESEDYQEVSKRYKEYKASGRIAFTTFHQSYGYEEFIEGIKPMVSYDSRSDGKKDIQYDVISGIFKSFCEKADPQAKSFDDAWDELVDKAISQESKFTFTRRTNSILQADLKDENTFVVTWSGGTYNTLRKDRVYEQWKANSYEENTNLRGGKRWMLDSLQAVIDVMIKQFGLPANGVTMTDRKNYVFIIDEINRGNISKIFGELITLIEPSKRIGEKEEMEVILPYSAKAFGVPGNVYIIGTMNTADRSIAAIDTALRRRFRFKEMLPDPDVLKDVYVEGLSISGLLECINKRITVLYDREHTIGHAYFIGLKESSTIDTLAKIFENDIIPLLQEYFYEDYEKIRLVLGDNKKEEKLQFITAKSNNYAALFGDADIGLDDGYSYEINKEAFGNIEAYRLI